MKAKGLSNGHSGHHHGLLWYCFECLFHHKKFLEEQNSFSWGWRSSSSDLAGSVDFFENRGDFDEYMRSVEEDH